MRVYPYARQLLTLEAAGVPLLAAHRAAERDGREEGLIDNILGALDLPEEDINTDADTSYGAGYFPGKATINPSNDEEELWKREDWEEPFVVRMRAMFLDAPPETASGADASVTATSAGTRGNGRLGLGYGIARAVGGASATAARRPSGGARDLEAVGSGAEADLVRERTLDRQDSICGG